VVPRASAQTPIAPEPSKSARVSGVVVDGMDGHLLRRAMVCFHRGGDTGYYNSNTERCDETDEQGRFNVAMLLPARYSYGVERDGYFAADPIADGVPSVIALDAGDHLSGVKLRMWRKGSISGRVVFADGEPFPGADLGLSGPADGNREKSKDTGEYRFGNLAPGDYRVAVKLPDIADCDHLLGRKPRLYVEQGAGLDTSPIHVDSGQEVSGPEIVMVEAMPRRVTGRVVSDSYPLPRGWRVSIGDRAVQAKNVDGSFDVCGLVPGEYTIRADGRIDGRMVAGDLKIRIENEDLKDVEIVPEWSASIRARIEVENNAAVDLSHTDILALSDSFSHGSYPQPRRESDGTFVIDEVYTGEYRFFVSPLPSGSYLESARLNGQDVIDAPILIHSGENLDSLVFTVSSKAGALTGVVQDETGSPMPGAVVMLQPDPPHGARDIHVCMRTADQSGGFTCDNLAPGKYRIAAWRGDPDMPQAWNEIASKGTPVELSEGGHVPIAVTVLRKQSK
jgi:hypothetical protein